MSFRQTGRRLSSTAQSGEKHVADVNTQSGMVIEFQHSHLDPLERAARERFYGNMVGR